MLRTEALHPSQLEEEGQLKTTEEKMQTVGNGADEAKTLRPLGLPLKLKPQVRMTLGEPFMVFCCFFGCQLCVSRVHCQRAASQQHNQPSKQNAFLHTEQDR